MEFTGERVIPGRVDPDLWSEHLARYSFATRLVEAEATHLGRSLRVLDAGCGTGYGSALLANCAAAKEVAAVDNSSEALQYAREHYASSNLVFSTADVTALPCADASFDLVVAFEVVEHLAEAQRFLAEARRVLGSAGRLLVSTPNHRYYSEERNYANPFHTREYLPEEFDALLAPLFPHRALWVQNHVPAQAFLPACCGPRRGNLEIENPRAIPAEAHFLIALASAEPLAEVQAFLFVSSGGNVLRDRELHIHKLEADLVSLQETTRRELEERKRWAEQQQQEVEARDRTIRELQQEHERTVAWARAVEKDLEEARAIIEERQQELDERLTWARSIEAECQRLAGIITELQRDLEDKLNWARSLEADLAKARTDFEERSAWAQNLEALLQQEREKMLAEYKRLEEIIPRQEAELQALRTDMQLILGSVWYRAGKKLGASPVPHCDNVRGGGQ